MQRPLDPLRFKQNRYERPNQEWVCGRAAEGRACPLGPDERGNCRATGECAPAKKGDRWFCSRSDAQGGKCEKGPLPNGVCSHPIPPCQPVPSLRRARGSLVWLFVALTTGVLLLLLGSSWRQRWIDPGTLSNAHATSAAKCSDCHSVADKKQSALVGLGAFTIRPVSDSRRCLNCHTLGDNPLAPHGAAPSQLASLTKRAQSGPNESIPKPLFLRVSHTLSPPHATSSELACSVCHREHHGRNLDLKQLSNQQCQTCHAVQFASFADGHPEFSNYPYRRRTPIFFDHASHLRQHFAEMKEKAPQSCQACHLPDSAGRFMKVKNFQATCAVCHEAQIQGAGMSVKGAAFFTLPGIDADTLASKGISVGEWPKAADGKITPYMELLLRREPEMQKALDHLQGVDLLDLTKATPDQLAAAEQFAWGVKQLLFHLVVDGQSYLIAKLTGEIAPAGIEIPRATFLAAQEEWMPHLLTEVTNFQNGIKPPLPKAAPSPTPTPASPNAKPASGDQSLLGGDDLAAAASPTPTGKNDDDLSAAVAAASPSPSPASGGKDDLAGGDLLSGASESPAPSPTPATAATPESKSAEEWVSAGGWYRPPDSFTLYYRPAGHADAFLVAWLTTAGKFASESATSKMQAVFRQLANPQSAGICLKCHTVDATGGKMEVQWLPEEAVPKKKSFTTFRHTTHLSLFGNTACETCHTIDPKVDYAKYFNGDDKAQAERDPMHFQSNFAPLSKTLCIQCHKPEVAGNSCLLCHRYHTGAVMSEIAEGRNTLRPLLGKK
jgi:hypothetical protein